MLGRVVVVGGGWAGCAAALAAAKAGAETVLVERTDMLLGTGLVGGIMRNNGRYTAADELTAMGGGGLIEICDRTSRHKNIDFPGHRHASFYDITTVLTGVERTLQKAGVIIEYRTRIKKAAVKEGKIVKVLSDDGREICGKVYVDATGTAGPVKSCTARGKGCVMCVIRCPAFGGRISLCAAAGVKEFASIKEDGSEGAMSGSCKILKESLDKHIINELNSKGVVILPLPRGLAAGELLKDKVCQQYALKEYRENIVLLDTGQAKLMMPWLPLENLRKIPGMEEARYIDPYAGGKGNSIRMTAMVFREDKMQVKGTKNLFCAGEKAGPLVGHTEAICTGTLAGHNAVRYVLGMPLLHISTDTAVGDFISYTGRQLKTREGRSKKYTFSGSVYFERMKQKRFYTIDKKEIVKRVKEAKMNGVFARKLL